MPFTFVLCLDFEENARKMGVQSLSQSRYAAWGLLTKKVKLGYLYELWKDHSKLLLAYMVAIENEWILRGFKSSIHDKLQDMIASDLGEDVPIPPEWQQPLIDTHIVMLYRLFPDDEFLSIGYEYTPLKHRRDYIQEKYGQIIEKYGKMGPFLPSTELFQPIPEYLQIPIRRCIFSIQLGDGVVAAPDKRDDEWVCTKILKGMEIDYCKRHQSIITETVRCAHLTANGEICRSRINLADHKLFCHRHTNEVDEITSPDEYGLGICQYSINYLEKYPVKCVRKTREGENFCRFHGGTRKSINICNPTSEVTSFQSILQNTRSVIPGYTSSKVSMKKGKLRVTFIKDSI